MIKYLLVFTLSILTFSGFTQSVDSVQIVLTEDSQSNTQTTGFTSPYTTKFWVDGPIILGTVGLNVLGVRLISNKHDITLQQLNSMSKNDIPFFDRGNAGYYSKSADDASYIPFHASFALPVVVALIDKNERSKLGQVLVLYTETMAITGALFTMTAGTVYRSRPYVYGDKVDQAYKLDNDSHRAFYAGHTAASASATFFMAKVFSDFNPHSKARPYVWALAAVIPATVGYLRYKAGMHFLSDNILGYVLGAGAGILVPELHKNKSLKNVTLVPQYGRNYKGVSLVYKF